MRSVLALPRLLTSAADVLVTFALSIVLPQRGQRTALSNATWAMHLVALESTIPHSERLTDTEDALLAG